MIARWHLTGKLRPAGEGVERRLREPQMLAPVLWPLLFVS
jgi:hypothetical protein